MNSTQLFLALLTVLACLSPLLTFTALFQQKEWRADRLIEHLKREGFFGQLFGKLRPALAVLLFLVDIVGLAGVFESIRMGGEGMGLGPFSTVLHVHEAGLIVFFGLFILQWFLKKQRMPVWTAKAMLIASLSMLLTFVIGFAIAPYLMFTPVFLLTMPFVVWTAWCIVLPIDRLMKLHQFARAGRMRRSLGHAVVIGIAGSVGKTTTKELLRCVLQDLNPVVTPEHVNTEMGVAQWLLSVKTCDSHVSTVVIEMGAYRKGEINLMCSFVQPTIGVMTALGSDHLALFGSEDAIVDANAELIESLPDDGHAFLYADNDLTRGLEPLSRCTVTLAGLDERASVRAEHVEQTNDGLQLTINGQQVTVALHGVHNVGNILLAIAVARHLGVRDERIYELLGTFSPLHHTFHVRQDRDVTVVDDTYNSSRLSIRAALHWARGRSERPRTLLMSALLETGPYEDRFLEELGKEAATSVERVILIDNKMKAAFERGYGQPVELCTHETVRVSTNSLLLCLGRMSSKTIEQLLPVS